MSPQRAQQLVEAGLWLRLSGDHEGAKRLFDQALKLDPGNARARQLIESAPGASAPMASPPDKPRSNPFARAEAPKSPMDLDWGLATGFSADPPPAAPPAAARPTIRTVETTPTVHVDADLMPPPVARVPTIAPVTPLEATVAQMADDEEMVELSGFPSEPGFSPDATTDPIAAAVPDDDDEISFSGGDAAPTELPPDPDVDVSFEDLAQEAIPPPPAAAEPVVEDISFDEFAGPSVGGVELASAAPDESSFADVSFEDSAVSELKVPTPQDVVFDDLSIDLDASGIAPPPPPAPAATAPLDDEIDLAGFEMEPPPPRPSAGLLPDAQSAWDARANPGISVESVEEAPLDLVEPPKPSSPPPAAPKSKQEEARALLQGARDLLELDDHTGAMELIVKAQTLAPEDPDVQAMRERSEQTLLRMYESKLGDMNQTPTRRLRDDDIIWLNLDHRAGFVLAQIDGTMSYEDVFAVSGMARFDTARILAQLIDQGVIATG